MILYDSSGNILTNIDGHSFDSSISLNRTSQKNYFNIGDFLNDPDERKWSKLKEPGQQNYVR